MGKGDSPAPNIGDAVAVSDPVPAGVQKRRL